MAQAAPARERRRLIGFSPRVSRKTTMLCLGITLALGSWVFQTWTTTVWMQQSQIRQSISIARMERDMWLIEYNANQLRFPQNQRVTGRAALHLFENTRELLALSEAARETSSARLAEIWSKRDSDIAQARKLFDEGSYSMLVSGLSRANEQFESTEVSSALSSANASVGMPIWQHALPWTFLAGVLLCVMGGLSPAPARDLE